MDLYEGIATPSVTVTNKAVPAAAEILLQLICGAFFATEGVTREFLEELIFTYE